MIIWKRRKFCDYLNYQACKHAGGGRGVGNSGSTFSARRVLPSWEAVQLEGAAVLHQPSLFVLEESEETRGPV